MAAQTHTFSQKAGSARIHPDRRFPAYHPQVAAKFNGKASMTADRLFAESDIPRRHSSNPASSRLSKNSAHYYQDRPISSPRKPAGLSGVH
jgi:hypothetical protein